MVVTYGTQNEAFICALPSERSGIRQVTEERVILEDTYLWSVLHNGAVVVRRKVERPLLVVLRGICRVDVLPVNRDPIISVAPHLLVQHSQSVPDLVDWDSKLHNGPSNRSMHADCATEQKIIIS